MANLIGDAGRAVFGDVGKDLADYLGRKFGALPDARNEAEEVAKRILVLRQAGRSDEVTEKMMSAADDPYMYANTPIDMSKVSRDTRADEMFPRKGYHGTNEDISGFQGSVFTSDNPTLASTYARGSADAQIYPLRLGSKLGDAVVEGKGKNWNQFDIDEVNKSNPELDVSYGFSSFGDGSMSTSTRDIEQAAKQAGLSGVQFKNINDTGPGFNSTQFKNFENAWNYFGKNIQRSILNSSGILNFAEYAHDWIRVGIGMYGGLPDFPELKTAMTFRSQIISIQSLGVNERIGYGGRIKVNRNSKIAIVYCGYADGFPQTTRDGTYVRVNNDMAPIIGRVSMDLISVDVTEIADCTIGDWCEFWSPELSINSNSTNNNLISYELMTKLSPRVKRQYLNV